MLNGKRIRQVKREIWPPLSRERMCQAAHIWGICDMTSENNMSDDDSVKIEAAEGEHENDAK